MLRLNGIFDVCQGALVNSPDDKPSAKEAGFSAEKPADIDLEWGVKIPMRDGVCLDATICRPHAQKGRLPVVFTLTPYIADSYFDRAQYFARNGYVFALVDVRGRGNSGGVFEPFVNEGRDGHDVVEWFSMQAWCNGSVSMWGGSYGGFDQWSTLKEFPPHLKSIVPAAAAHLGVDFPGYHGILTPYDMQWLTFTSGVTGNASLFGNMDFWISKYTELYTKKLPFRELDSLVGNTKSIFQKWLAHPAADEYWSGTAPDAEDYAKIDIPILTITGHYDGDQPGAMTYYKRHMQFGSETAKSKHYLVIGPWDHAGTRTPKKEFGGMTFGDASLVDLNKLHKEWYDWTLKNGKKPEFLKDRVSYYVAGEEKWKYASNLGATSKGERTFYLASEGGGESARSVFRSGALTDAPLGDCEPDTYVYDPLNTSSASFYQKEIQNSITDQTLAMGINGNGLVYHSERFDEDVEFTGEAKLVTWIQADVPDLDFLIEIYEIRANGTSISLTSDMMRARYRESQASPKLLTPGETYRYEFKGFTFFSRRVSRGSRLRLVITCPNSIYIQKNYCSGGDVSAECGNDARTANVALYHDRERASYLELPLGS